MNQTQSTTLSRRTLTSIALVMTFSTGFLSGAIYGYVLCNKTWKEAYSAINEQHNQINTFRDYR